MGEYSQNNGNIESYKYPEKFEKAANEGKLYEYALKDPVTLEMNLKKVSIGDKEYEQFLTWLDNPFRSRIGCKITEGEWSC